MSGRADLQELVKGAIESSDPKNARAQARSVIGHLEDAGVDMSFPPEHWDVVMNDVSGKEIRIGPWPKWQADNLAAVQRLWHRTLKCPDKVYVRLHVEEKEKGPVAQGAFPGLSIDGDDTGVASPPFLKRFL